jgi:hypothetical protein
MKAKLIRWIAEWIYKKYPYLMKEIVVGHGKHIHGNPQKGRKKVENE